LLEYQQTPFTYQWIGQIYLLKNETPQGITYLEKARERSPSNTTLLYNLCCAYYKISRFEKGNEVLGELKHSSVDPSLLRRLDAIRKSSMDNYARAVEYNQKAQNLLKLKDYNRAYPVLQQSLRIQETSTAYELIGVLNLARGNKTKALTYFERANQMNDASNPQLLYHLSVAYYINEEYDKARTLFENLKTTYPDFPDPNNLNTRLHKHDKHLMN
jgi:tetratricopeptide (TPR) repeat protein